MSRDGGKDSSLRPDADPAELWKALNEKDNQLRSANDEIARLDSAVLQQHAELTNLRGALERQGAKDAQLLRNANHELIRLQDEVDHKSKEAILNAEMLARLQHDFQEKANQLRIATAELGRLGIALDENDSALKGAGLQIAALIAEVNLKQGELDAAIASREEFRAEVEPAFDHNRSEVDRQEVELLRAGEQMKKAAEEIATLRAELTIQKEDLDRHKQMLATRERDLQQQKRMLYDDSGPYAGAAGDKFHPSNKKFSPLQSMLEEKEAALQRLEYELGEQRYITELLQKELHDVRSMETSYNDKDAELRKLQEEVLPMVDIRVQEAETLKIELGRCTASVRRKDSELQFVKGELARMHSSAEVKDKDLINQDRELQEMQAELRELEKSVRVAKEENTSLQDSLEFQKQENFRLDETITRMRREDHARKRNAEAENARR